MGRKKIEIKAGNAPMPEDLPIEELGIRVRNGQVIDVPKHRINFAGKDLTVDCVSTRALVTFYGGVPEYEAGAKCEAANMLGLNQVQCSRTWGRKG